MHLAGGAGPLFAGLPGAFTVWMSHGDSVTRLPRGFGREASTADGILAAVGDEERRFYGLQFHPEVAHTEHGRELLRNFLFRICEARADWDLGDFRRMAVERIREQVGDDGVVCGLSGGVDSAVVACLVHEAVGDRLTSVFVDHGLLRKGEAGEVMRVLGRDFGLRIVQVNAADRFLDKLEGVEDPERKRKIIGEEFIRVFEAEARKLPGVRHLAQGTLYPDVIESVSVAGPSARIKSHHNVGGLPERMDLSLVEPVRELFKDEVRELGRGLGLPEAVIGRHPFPGPGLAVRILGPVTREAVAPLQDADRIYMEELRESRPLRRHLAGLRGPAPGALGGGDGGRAHLRQRGRAPGGEQRGRDDRGLVPLPPRRPGPDRGAHRQHVAGGEPRRLRCDFQASRHHRVGVGTGRCDAG